MFLTKKVATGLGALALAASVLVSTPAVAAEVPAVTPASSSAAAAAGVSTQSTTTTATYLSNAEVRRIYDGMKATGSLCSVAPIPWPVSIACAGFAPAEAIEQAYWQDKRVRVDYTSCGFNYCSYTTFHVVD